MKHAPFRIFDGMTWPAPCERLGDIEYALRYAPEVSKNERLVAASVISAYMHLVRMPERTRRLRIREIRKGPS